MKIIITGIDSINKIELAKYIISKDDELSICPTFTSDDEYIGKISDNYIYYLNPNIIDLSYKNNSFIYISTENYISNGITIDDFYNNDIICLSTKNFNKIINDVFEKHDCLIVWVDSKFHEGINSKEELTEIKYLEEIISKQKYLYFIDEDFDIISDIILKYITGTEETKSKILEENS